MIEHYNNLIKIQIQDSEFELYIYFFSKKYLTYYTEKSKAVLFRYHALV